MTNFATWQAATKCSDGAKPGARALMAWCLEQYDNASNLGIYNCRSVRGAATTSTHGEGRACDVGFPGARGNSNGHKLVNRLREHGKALGIQAIIYCRVIYSAKSPNGRPYTGLVPHWDHVHIELTRSAAEKLTLATIRKVISGETSTPTPQPATKTIRLKPIVWYFEGTHGTHHEVTWIQQELKKRKYYTAKVDGLAGPKTRAAYASWQRHLGYDGSDADGIPGRNSLQKLGFKVV